MGCLASRGKIQCTCYSDSDVVFDEITDINENGGIKANPLAQLPVESVLNIQFRELALADHG
jgi:hypothetical protein